MSESITPRNQDAETSLQTLGGVTLVASLVVSLWSLFDHDPVTAVAVLVYVPVGMLLVRIGKERDLG